MLGVRLNVCPSVPSLVVALVSCVLLSTGGRAWAQRSELPGIRIEVPDDCAPPGELKRALAELLGENMTVVRPVTLRITGPDARAEYRLQLRLPNDRRELRDAACRTLLRSAAVMIASAIVPASEARKTSGPSTEPVDPKPSAARGRTGDASGALPVLLGAGGILGVVPGLAPQLELLGGLSHRRWGLLLGLSYVGSGTAGNDAALGVSLDAVGGRLAGLYRAATFLDLRAGAALRRLSGSGRGGALTQSAAAWSLALQLELAFVPLHFGAGWLEVGLVGECALVRPSFEFESGPQVHRVSPFGAGVLARVGWDFL
jgi:hypothetical protein